MGHWKDEFEGWVEDEDEVSSPPYHPVTSPLPALNRTAGHRIPQSARKRGGKLGGQRGKGRKKNIDPEVARARARNAAKARWKKP